MQAKDKKRQSEVLLQAIGLKTFFHWHTYVEQNMKLVCEIN